MVIARDITKHTQSYHSGKECHEKSLNISLFQEQDLKLE